MGKWRKRKRNEANKKKEENNRKRPIRAYADFVRENASFEKYYKAQKVCPEEEWDLFMSTLRENLPVAFRISGYKTEARALLNIVRGQYFKDILLGNDEAVKPVCLPWYPDELAWQLNLTRKDIRRSEVYFRLHNFLISETASGNISRQEVVSMIPPLLLDVQPHHKVLDMCAAPGSKTSQLIELLHAEEGKLPDGLVVANDVDNKRCYMLVHQAKRLQSPCIIITNHDSSVLPNLYITKPDGNKSILKFDRVLADVPCSGDGTLRKNPDVWAKWNIANGNNLHSVQYRIVRRGVELLGVGGRIVYSTCSLNPVEDEAVIHRMLADAKDSLELVDVSSSLPGLKYVPGLSTWVPMSRDLERFASFDEVPEKLRTQIRPSMFPPSEEEAPKYNLHRCIRILPHQQDTGAFFVAVLEKKSLLPWESGSKAVEVGSEETSESNNAKRDRSDHSPSRKRRKLHGYKEDPFCFLEPDDPIWPSIRDFYEVDSCLQPPLLLTRCRVGKKKNIYFVSSTVRDVVVNNEHKVKIINTGVKTFVRCDNKAVPCDFRLAQEGIHVSRPFISRRIISVTREDLVILLTNDDPDKPPEMTTLDLATQQQFSQIEGGSCILSFHGDDDLKIELVGWKGKTSVRAYVAKDERIHYLRLCGADVSKFEVNKFKEKRDIEERDESEIKDSDDDLVQESEDSVQTAEVESNAEENDKVDGETENKTGGL